MSEMNSISAFRIKFIFVPFFLILLLYGCVSAVQPSDAKFAFSSGDYNKAVELYERLCLEFPNNHEYRYWLAVSLFKGQQFKESFLELDKILQRNPKNLKALALKAEIFLAIGKVNLGQQELEGIIALHPNDIKSYLRLSQVFRIKKQPDRAITILMTVLFQKPEDAKLLLTLHEIYAQELKDEFLSYYYLKRYSQTGTGKTRFSDIQYHLSKLEQDKPEFKVRYHDRLYLDKARNLIGEKRYSEAETILNRVTQQDESWARLIGEVYLETDRPFEAQIQLERSVKTNPNDVETNYLIGWAYMRMGSKDLAIKHWRKVLELDPGNKKAQFALDTALNP